MLAVFLLWLFAGQGLRLSPFTRSCPRVARFFLLALRFLPISSRIRSDVCDIKRMNLIASILAHHMHAGCKSIVWGSFAGKEDHMRTALNSHKHLFAGKCTKLRF